jgi:hypothetical protein
MGALAADRQAAAMTQAAITAQIHQPLDVHRIFTPQVTLDAVFTVDQFADAQHLVIGELVHAAGFRDRQARADFLRLCRADAVDIAKADQHPLVGRDVYAGNTRHAQYSCRPDRSPTRGGRAHCPEGS